MKSFFRIALALIAFVLLVAGGLYLRFHLFRVEPVTEGIFRARQPGARELADAIDRYHFRTIINLRGKNPTREWYRQEMEVANSRSVSLVSLPFETFDWPPRIETSRFVEAIRKAKRPVLIHCATGIDRSGWASAVTRLLRGDSFETAVQEELSRARGHFCDVESCPLHQFFQMYRRWLAARRIKHDAATFEMWASEIYCPVPYDARIEFIDPPPRVTTAGSELTMRVMVGNASPVSWAVPLEGAEGVRLGARLLGPFDEAPATPLELFRIARAPAKDLYRDRSFVGKWNPGLTRQIPVSFVAPARPGLYYVQIDMVDELVHWFSDLGREGLIVPLEVRTH